MIFTNMGDLQVLFHTMVVSFNPLVLLFSVALIVSTVLVSVWRINFEETPDRLSTASFPMFYALTSRVPCER